MRKLHQCRIVIELPTVIVRHFKYDARSLEVYLVTAPDEYPNSKQEN